MNVLIGYESSGVTREAFRRLGYTAWSCDLLPADDKSPYHFQCDIKELLKLITGIDLVILHPPCTYLTSSAEWAYGDGPYHQNVKPETLTGAARREAREKAIADVLWLWSLPIERMVIENPKGTLSTRWMKPTQIIQPHEYGDDASKETHLWMRGVPKLIPTKHVPPRMVMHKGNLVARWANQTDSGQNKLSPSADRWKERSKTYQGIADAFASQLIQNHDT